MAHRLVLSASLCLAACARTAATCETPQELDSQPPARPSASTSVEADEDARARAACGNLGHIAATSGTARAEVISLESDCVATFARLRLQPDALSECVIAARSTDDILACEQGLRAWPALLGGGRTATPDAVCDHVMGIMQFELGAALPMSPDDITRFRTECIREMEAERIKLGEPTFQRQAGCVLEAHSLADLERCDDTRAQP